MHHDIIKQGKNKVLNTLTTLRSIATHTQLHSVIF